ARSVAEPSPSSTTSSRPSRTKVCLTASKPNWGVLQVPTTHLPESPTRSSQRRFGPASIGVTQSSWVPDTVEVQTRRTGPAPRSEGCCSALPRPGSSGSPTAPDPAAARSEQSTGRRLPEGSRAGNQASGRSGGGPEAQPSTKPETIAATRSRRKPSLGAKY